MVNLTNIFNLFSSSHKLPGDDVRKSIYVEHINQMLNESENGSTIYTSENSVFLNRLLHHRRSKFKELMSEKDIIFKIFTWEDSPIEELHNLGAKVYLLEREFTEHYTLLDKPKMLRVELNHPPKTQYAYDITFTTSPYPETHKGILDYFTKNLEKEAKLFEPSIANIPK